MRDRTYTASPVEIAGALRDIAAALPRWRFIGYDPESGIVRMEQDTPVITYTDDVTVRMCRDGTRTLVSAESRSRVGSFDFGVNARRLKGLLRELDRRMEQVRERRLGQEAACLRRSAERG